MNAFTDHTDTGFSLLNTIAAAVLDAQGAVLWWSRAAAELLDRPAAEVCGHPVGHLLAEESACRAEAAGNAMPTAGRALLRHRSGGKVEVAFRTLPMEVSSHLLVLAAPTRHVTDWEQGAALLRALLAQDRIGIGIYDADLRSVRTNITPDRDDGPALSPGGRLAQVTSAPDAETAETVLRQVLATGVPLVEQEQPMRSPQARERQRFVSLSAVRLEDTQGHPVGVAALSTDATERQRVRRHLELSHQASVSIGRSLDVQRTAQDLVDVLVPALGDLAWVNLAEAVLNGDEPPKFLGGGELHLRRAAVASATGPWPAAMLQPGATVPHIMDWPGLRTLQSGEAFILPDRASAIATYESTPDLIPLLIPERGHSVALAPLAARGLMLGTVAVWRTERTEPFADEDADLLAEIASRAALSVDTARRYTREHRAAVALQQRLLPRAGTDTPAAETAGLYLPAGGGAEISGDWFDVIPLPSLRTALVVGDVVGHGLPATATMGRLRTAVQTLADLELEPEELLTHLDDLVQRLAGESAPEHQDAFGATCLYAVYDPIARHCTLASAGHPPPVLVRPDGTVRTLDISPGPPLGVGGMPFETITLDLAPDSVLALYTNALIDRGRHDLDGGLRLLTDRLAALCRPARPLAEVGRRLLADAADPPPRDDIALLLARTRAIPPEHTASWEFPANPTIVADARGATVRQLAAWGLDDLTFTTELIVSELVTNAIRYAGGPVGLRLIRDQVLICEVTDPSNTQPRLRRARWTDEGGRGLFLVAQLTTRWGSRYSRSGKTIWAEQPLPAGSTTAHRT
ncbi:SpoIIE family protein phosphatase [Streptomyces sp. NPDC044780]|uniref:SpoIIE family protein phosphatase n=1 Tax=unclassified Streptomyces TaxID=2593676 RepID=UPI0033C7BE41